jgi:hypothetical protein
MRDIILNLLVGAIASAAASTVVFTAFNLRRALRAKHRSHWLLAKEAVTDEELRLLIERAVKGALTNEELNRATPMIEAKLSHLPETDRKCVHEGLTQSNRVGRRRYCVEMLTGA